MTSDEQKFLMDAAIDGEISAADFLRLEAELAIDPAARRDYYDRVCPSMMLSAEALATSHAPVQVTSPRSFWLRAFAGMSAIAASLFFALAWQFPRTVSREFASKSEHILEQRSTKTEQRDSGFAVLFGQARAVWATAEPAGLATQDWRPGARWRFALKVWRWGLSASALDFSPPGSRVRLSIPGKHRGLTLMCWVRINSWTAGTTRCS